MFAGYPFKYLYDGSQDVAKAYQAACTPEFYLADGNLHLYYHGQFDGSRPSNDIPVSGKLSLGYAMMNSPALSCGSFEVTLLDSQSESSMVWLAAGEDVRAAIDSLLNQQFLDRPMRPSMGCGIKWHPSK